MLHYHLHNKMKHFLISLGIVLTLFSTGVAHADVTVTPNTGSVTNTDTSGSVTNTNPSGSVTNTNPSGSVTNTSNTSGALLNPLNASSLTDLLNEILGYVVMLGGIFLTIMLVYVGFLFVAARGNDEKIRSARAALMWTVVGGLLLLGASALSQVIAATVKGL
jgi:hypothetical protein